MTSEMNGALPPEEELPRLTACLLVVAIAVVTGGTSPLGDPGPPG